MGGQARLCWRSQSWLAVRVYWVPLRLLDWLHFWLTDLPASVFNPGWFADPVVLDTETLCRLMADREIGLLHWTRIWFILQPYKLLDVQFIIFNVLHILVFPALSSFECYFLSIWERGSVWECECVRVWWCTFYVHLLGFLWSVFSGNTLHRVIVIFDEISTLLNKTPIKYVWKRLSCCNVSWNVPLFPDSTLYWNILFNGFSSWILIAL